MPPQEIIVVDDGSTDDTAAIIDNEFPQVKYIHQANQGVSRARNTGIQQALGDWIALLDSDDEWLPRKLEMQAEVLQNHGAYRICHTDEIWVRRGKRVNPMRKHQKYGGHIFDKCLPLCVISPSSAVIERRLLTEVGLFDEALAACEDYDMWLRICSRYPVAFVSDQLIVKYGGHKDQLSQKYWGMDRFRIKALEKLLLSKTLAPEQAEMAYDMMRKKCHVYIQGARKRNKHHEVDQYERMLARCSEGVAGLGTQNRLTKMRPSLNKSMSAWAHD
jgi:glycosyltransferase involved in cell wall biosynthesis